MIACDTTLFPRRLRATRLSHRFSQADLAARVDLVKGSISDFETGRLQPCLDTFLKLSWSLRVCPHWLRGYPNNNAKKESHEEVH